MENIVGLVNGMINVYCEGEVDVVYIVYNCFENMML